MTDATRDNSGGHLFHRYFDDIHPGDRLVSRGRTITETDIVNWCALTGDWHVLHTDAEHAAQSMFGQRIAPGILIFAIAAGLGVPPDSPRILANYGTDRLRFLAPTFIGDTLHLEAEVQQCDDGKDDRSGVLTLSWNMVNQNGRTVMASDLKVLMERRPAEGRA